MVKLMEGKNSKPLQTVELEDTVSQRKAVITNYLGALCSYWVSAAMNLCCVAAKTVCLWICTEADFGLLAVKDTTPVFSRILIMVTFKTTSLDVVNVTTFSKL